MASDDVKKYAALDARLVEICKKVKILSQLAWPAGVDEVFLANWKAKKPKNPESVARRVDLKEEIVALETLVNECDLSHPIGNYIGETAQSYVLASNLLMSQGTKRFTECSATLYGRPTDGIESTGLTHLDAAKKFIDITKSSMEAYQVSDADDCLTAEEAAAVLKDRLGHFFSDDKINVVIDDGLNSKAAAGSQRIRLRGNTHFSHLDVDQLIQHEGFVHMLTGINGRRQKDFASFGLGSPRTTRTQEGLATFSELITGTMDLNRLRRIALRIPAVQMGLEGADFIEVFRFFLESGQSEKESFQSTARVFRGGEPNGGGIVFTKDSVYIQGLIYTHLFLLKSIETNKFFFAEHLFMGRLTLGDIVRLEPFIEKQWLLPPRYLPPWLRNRQKLAAFLTYSSFINQIALKDFTLEDFALRGI